MKKWQIAAAVLAALALINGLFWSLMAFSTERGLKELDLNWWE